MKMNHLSKVFLLSILCIWVITLLYSYKAQQNKEIVVSKNINLNLYPIKNEVSCTASLQSVKDEKEVVKSSKIGFINSIYDKNEDTFIIFNETEFYRNEDAQREYAKDGFNPSNDAWGHDYYIRYNSKEQKTYKLSNDCKFNICAYLVEPKIQYKIASEIRAVSKDDFKTYVYNSFYKYNHQLAQYPELPKYNRGLLFWINTEDDIVTNIDMQYTP